MKLAGYYKLPVPQTSQENCVAHNGSLIPVPGRDIKVQAWYQGGISVFDFTDPGNPFEIAFFDRGPIDETQLVGGGHWSAYWYNGYIYGSEMARGLDVLRLTPTEHLTQNEIDAAMLVRFDKFNAQHQPKISWPAVPVVARAYVDQLVRANAMTAAQASDLSRELGRLEAAQPGAQRQAAVEQILGHARRLEADALSAVAAGRGDDNAARIRALLASVLRELAAS